MKILLSVLSLAFFSVMPAIAQAEEAGAAFTDGEKAAIEEVVRNLLVNKEPDIVMKAAQEIQRRQEAEATANTQKALSGSHDKLYNNAKDPVGGNPKGDIAVVEFFDYQCGYCKMAHEAVSKLIAEDKNVKIIYKEYPILGPGSQQAAKAALASVKQGKYQKFHDALMTVKDRLSDDVIFKAAQDAGLNVEKLKKDMADPALEAQVKETIALGQEVGARGTPTFVIADKLYPGAMPYDQLKKIVDEARASAKK